MQSGGQRSAILHSTKQGKLDALPSNVKSSCHLFEPEHLSLLGSMIKSHMELNVWREDDTLMLTGGEHCLD